MKKLLIATNLLFIAIIIFQSCGYVRTNGSFNINKDPLYSSCYNCLVDDLHGETAQEFTDVTARYRTYHYKVYNAYNRGQLTSAAINNPNFVSDPNFIDARSCWYSIDTLKKFICLMEKYSAKVGLTSSQLGVRLYYSVYPSSYSRDQQLAKHTTLFLTATAKQSGSNSNIDFDPRISASSTTKKITTLADLIALNNGVQLFILAGNRNAGGNASMNQGELCPPGTGCINTLGAIDNAYPTDNP